MNLTRSFDGYVIQNKRPWWRRRAEKRPPVASDGAPKLTELQRKLLAIHIRSVTP